MRRTLMAAAALIVASLACAAEVEQGSRAMTGWFNVETPEGWRGRRYMDGSNIFAEEFDSRGSGRIDVWRFYRRGLLSSEERDLDGDGRVDFQSRWDAKNVRLIEVLRDTNRRGVNDLEIEADGMRRWIVREDRNLDGIADRILYLSGPPDFFDRIGFELATQRNVIDSIPREYWSELWVDDGYSGNITAYYRFQRGIITHRGQWDGKKVGWRRASEDYAPPPPPPLQSAAPQQPRQTETIRRTPQQQPYIPYDGDIRDPFDLNAPGNDPYEGLEYTGQPFLPPDEPPARQEGPAYDYQYDSSQPSAPYPSGPGARDRTRYEGMPPGESAARSVPARMRPPGVSRR